MAEPTPEEKLDAYINGTVDAAISANAVQLVREALQLIANGLWPTHERALRLAALRRYLRFQNRDNKSIRDHWTWTAAEARQRLNEEPARTLVARARVVQRTFAENNAGYWLDISPVRSLARQVTLWNDNASIRTAAAALQTTVLTELAKAEYVNPPQAAHLDAFRLFVQRAGINPEPGNAAPGLSSHGQMRAVDFIVMQGQSVIATTEVATSESVWRARGWAGRLATEARRAGFTGPLRVPDEPWHWWIQ